MSCWLRSCEHWMGEWLQCLFRHFSCYPSLPDLIEYFLLLFWRSSWLLLVHVSRWVLALSHLTLQFLSQICALLVVHKQNDYTHAFLQPSKAHETLYLWLRGWKIHSLVLEWFVFHIVLHIFIYFGARDNVHHFYSNSLDGFHPPLPLKNKSSIWPVLQQMDTDML